MPESIVLITIDQPRFDSLGVHGDRVCSTPALDGLVRWTYA